MNQQQIAAYLRLILAVGGPLSALIISKTGISQADYISYLEVFLSIAPPAIVGVWSWYRNREDVQIKVTENLPSVATVVVKDNTNGVVGALALSDAHPNIVTETQNEFDAKQGTKTP